MASISLKNIKKIYSGGVVAVHDFNLEIQDQEFVILVGPSGCGKSTTLRMIAGLEEISEGELFIGDTKVNELPPKERDIAMVFQNYALYPHMSVYKNMAFALKLKKMPKDEIKAKVDEAAKILQIEDYLERKPKALSGGQRQRVALGRAMVRNPKVFLLDEPLSNLDAKLRTEMRTEISKLHKRLGTTFVYVTHDQMEAMTMGDRIVVMKDGFIQQVDTPQNLYEKPGNMFVASFIGSPKMNFLNVEILEEEGSFFVLLAGKRFPVVEGKASQDVLRPYIGKTVILGIRAENLWDEVKNIDHSLEVDVDLTELMGSEVYAYFTLGEEKLVAKLPPHTPAKVGEKFVIELDVRAFHLFDKETGLTICN